MNTTRTDEHPDFYVTDHDERIAAWLEACPVNLSARDLREIGSILEDSQIKDGP